MTCKIAYKWFLLSLIMFSSISFVHALPVFDIDVTLEDDFFYTMPLLEEKTLRYNFTSTFEGEPFNTNVTSDIIKGDAETYWEERNLGRRIVYHLSNLEIAPKTSILEIDTESMIENNLMRSDCLDTAFYDGFGNPIKYSIHNCNSNTTRFKLFLENTDNDFLNFYFSGTSVHSQSSRPYKFYEDFTNESISNLAWDLHGNITFVDSSIYTDALNKTSLNLTQFKINKSSDINFRFFATGNSYFNITLLENYNLFDRHFSIHFFGDSDIIRVCNVRDTHKECFDRNVMFSENWNEFKISLQDDSIWFFLNDNKLNNFGIRYNIEDAYLSISTNGMVFFDYISVSEWASTSFFEFSNQELINWFEGLAMQGDYWFHYSLTGFESGIYTIATKATRPELQTQYAFNQFETENNRIIFETNERGYVNELAGRYLIDTEGTLTIRNNNDQNVSINIDLDTPILLKQRNGELLKNNRLKASIPAFSSISLEYFTMGVTNYRPYRNNKGILALILKQAIDNDVHEMGLNRFRIDEFQMEDVVFEESDEPDIERKELRLRVDDDFVFDVFTRLSINKYFSSTKVRPGEIIEVFLRVRNYDPFSREVELFDKIPEEFVILDRSSSDNVLSWNFKMNKHTSRIFSYKLKYEGSSTGRVDVPRANLTSEGLLVYSNLATLLRDNPLKENLHLDKKYRILESDIYNVKNPVSIRLTLSNLADKPVRELILDDSFGADVTFMSPSVNTPYIAKWIIPELKPGETWSVEYITSYNDYIRRKPVLDSFVDEISYRAFVNKEELSPSEFYFRRSFSFSLQFILTLLVMSNIFIILYYAYKNPFFDIDEEMTPTIFMTKIYEQTPLAVREVIDSFHSFYTSIFNSFSKTFKKFALKSYKFSSKLMESSKKYYEERNISLVHERSIDTSHKVTSKLNSELNKLKSMSIKDWTSLFIKYKKDFFTALKNRITYSMFLISDKLISKNENSKMGRILNFSSKVLNPELDQYLAELADKKIVEKQKEYKREIDNIESLLAKNQKIKDDYSVISKNPFRKLINFFKK